MQRKMGYRDLRTVKEFILRKSYQDDELTQDEERFMDVLNRQVRSSEPLQTIYVLIVC